MADNVNHPAHYNVNGYEALDIIKAFLKDSGMNEIDAYETGNIIKYILRWPRKNGLEDLEKAEFYLRDMTSRKKAEEAWGDDEDDAILWCDNTPYKVTSKGTGEVESCSVMEDKEAKKEMLRDWLKEMTEKGVKVTELEDKYVKGNND